jgi:hypothetical protein
LARTPALAPGASVSGLNFDLEKAMSRSSTNTARADEVLDLLQKHFFATDLHRFSLIFWKFVQIHEIRG